MLQLNITQQLGTFSLDLSADLPANGVTAIFGRSGAGKSSLINLIAGLSTPQTGTIRLNGRVLFDSQTGINLPPEKRNIGYVFQEHRLFPHYSVEKNLTYGCKRPNSAKFLQIIELLGIQSLLKRYPNHLSGGEKQRVAIGRALLTEPDILLMDEPLSALDLPRKKELLNYLDTLAKQVSIPILYVSHSLDEIIRLADYLLLLENGKAIAFDRLPLIWQSDAFRAWQPNADKINLLELPLITKDEATQMQALALGSQRLWLETSTPFKLGEQRRVTFTGSDISLTLEPPPPSSYRTILQGNICKLLPQNNRLDIAVDVEQQIIWLSLNLWAAQQLNLQPTQRVYLQIKTIPL